jgi:hypothetical protein
MSSSVVQRSSRRIALAVVIFFLPCSLAFAEGFTFDPVRPEIMSAHLDGYGGAYCATDAGFDTLSTNPAALAFVSGVWSIARLSTEISGPLFDLSSALQSDDMTMGILDLVGANNGIYMGANVTGPIAFGKVDRNFGFGVFNRTITSVDLPSLTSATLLAGEEFLLTGGYGLPFFEKGPHILSAGLQLKGFFQTFAYQDGTALSVLDSLTSLSVDGIPSVLSTGFGLDAGIMYRLGDWFSAGITCKDLYTPVFTTQYANYEAFFDGSSAEDSITQRLDPLLSCGVAFDIPFPENWVTVSNWSVMLDYRDFLDLLEPVRRNILLNFAIGTELDILDVVSLRAGIRETYLSAGVGVDLSVCKIDFAMYGTELGIDPGKRPLLNIAFSLAFEY